MGRARIEFVMSKVQSQNQTHDGQVSVNEGARQAISNSLTATAATAKAADIAHYRSCLASALTNSCGPGPFLTALRELGVGS